MKINFPLYISSDHGGYQLKKRLIRYCQNELEIEIEDMGPFEHDPLDDFPDLIIPTAKKAVKKNGRAILICGSGIGACISANKVKGMYAGLGYNIEVAGLMRQHNNTNGLCLAGRILSEDHAMAIVKKWLETDFLEDEKYKRRNEKIKNEEKGDAELLKKCKPAENAKLQKNNSKLIYPELSYKINGIIFKVKKELGENVNEKQACDKVEFYFKEEEIPYIREFILPTSFEGETKGRNRIDFIVDDKIIIEAKSKRFISPEDYHQIQRYLQAIDKKLGILVNFRDKRIIPKRILNSNAKE